jgi:hypothetical protein
LKALIIILALLTMLAFYAAIAAGLWFLFPAISYLKWLVGTILLGVFVSVTENGV